MAATAAATALRTDIADDGLRCGEPGPTADGAKGDKEIEWRTDANGGGQDANADGGVNAATQKTTGRQCGGPEVRRMVSRHGCGGMAAEAGGEATAHPRSSLPCAARFTRASALAGAS